VTTDNKRRVLYLKDDRSAFDAESPAFQTLFAQVDTAGDRTEAVMLFQKNGYDFVIGDLSVEPERAGVLKQIKDLKPATTVFAMLSPDDSDKLYGIADMNINAFELTPEHFDLALAEIAKFNPGA
jgi:DNA-binding NtrC family response regulator